MNTKRSTRTLAGVVATLIVATVVATVLAQPGQGATPLEFDVAEIGTRFIFDEAPVFDDGMPAYGNAFVTQGYIYQPGTLGDGDGVLADGSPEFPDKVIGEWTCRGYFIGDGAHAESGAMVITTQFYAFGEDYGGAGLVTEGYELADIGVVGRRAVTGGIGAFSEARGEAQQTLLGFNESMGVNLRFALEVSN